MATSPVLIRPPRTSDLRRFVAQAAPVIAVSAPWVYAAGYAGCVQAWLAHGRPPSSLSRLPPSDGAIAGVVNLSQIIRGARVRFVGYYAFAGFERRA